MQNPNQEPHISLLFALLRAGLTGQTETLPVVDEEQWRKSYEVALEHGVQAIAWDGLSHIAAVEGVKVDAFITRRMKMRFIYGVDSVEKKYAMQYGTAAELAALYAGAGVRTIVLKGIAASMNYPRPEHRPCGDLDCFLPDSYECGNDIARQAGADVDLEFYKHSHIVYKGLTVENHQFCTAIRGSRKAKDFERLLRRILREEPSTRIGDTALESPSPYFNALFLTHHAQRHLLSEGIALRHLCDWAMLIDKHGSQIDWTEFNAVCDRYGLRHFADAMSRLAHKLLGVTMPDGYVLPADDERDEFLLREMIYGMQHLYASTDSKWRQRLMLFRNIAKNRTRYRLFGDVSYIADIIKFVYGFIFDRNPEL